MSDLRTLLRDAAGSAPVAPAFRAVDADLRRGRRALVARRARWAAVPAGLLVVSATATVVPGSPFAPRQRSDAARQAPSASAPAPASVRPPSGTATATAVSIKLVGYTGTQPAGYTVDRVPDGWEIQAIDPYSLVIAPVGFKDADPTSFEGKIMVSKANEGEISVHRDGVRPLRVGGVTAKFFTFPGADPASERSKRAAQQAAGRPVRDDGTTFGLLLPAGHGDWLIFQLPDTLHWDAATVAAFAAGVHLTSHAVAAAG